MRSNRRFLAALILAATTAASALGAGVPRRLVVVLRPAADPAVVRTVLARRGFSLEPPLWSDAKSAVHTAAAVGAWDTTAAFDALAELRRAGSVIGGGELLGKDRRSIRFYSGRVLVHFRGPIDEPRARAWGKPLDLALLRIARNGTWFLFDAPLDAASLLALTTRPPGPAIDVMPIVPELSASPAVPAPESPAVYHKIPADRNKLVVLLEPGTDAAYRQFLEAHHAIVISGPNTSRQIVQFRDEDAMMAAQADIGAVKSVSRAGPLLSEKPLAFLTNQLVVRFRSPLAAQQAGFVLDTHNIHESRELSYLEDGFLYQLPLPSYELYDVARELILEGHALFAVPNVATFSESACHETECKDVSIPHLDYLRMIKACDVRAASDVVLAILDEGIQAATSQTFNDRLRVETAIDFETMSPCEPPNPSDWWSTTSADPCWLVFNPPSSPRAWQAGHGNQMAVLAAADCDDGDLLGIAPASPLINARRRDSGGGAAEWTDVAFADALWWLGGGDPAWCRDSTNYPCTGAACSWSTPATCAEGALPIRLDALHRAGVINLSFVRPDFFEPSCPDPTRCQPVCADPAHCGAIDGVLERIRTPITGDGIRDGGTVIVAAAGIEGTIGSKLCYDANGQMTSDPGGPLTDLAESPWTVAVGSVRTTGEPFFPDGKNQCLINFGGGFLDVVAPMGSNCTLCTDCGPGPLMSGASSAATAVVSGVVTLMLQQNPQLTAAQVQCILRETANAYSDPGEIWQPGSMTSWRIPACPFDSNGHSNCLGYGMVDAGAAVTMARLFKNPQLPACLCPIPPPPPPPPPLGVFRTDIMSDLEVAATQEWRTPKMPPPPVWGALRACIESGPCRCATDRNCFMRASMRNLLLAHVPAATFKICGGKECRPLEGPAVDWAPDGVLVVRLEMGPEYLQWAREQAGRLELRLFSGGRAVTKKMLAKMRKVRAPKLEAHP